MVVPIAMASSAVVVLGPVSEAGAITFSKPAAPALTQVTAGHGTLTATWTASASGSPTGYTVTAASVVDGSATCTVGTVSGVTIGTNPYSGTLSCTISGLLDTISYSVTVTGTNRIGTSDASSATSKAPEGNPDPVTGFSATPGDSTLATSWTMPSSNAGAGAVTVTATPGGHQCTPATIGATTCTVTGLTNGTTYSLSAVVSYTANSTTYSSSAATASSMPSTVPGPPTNVSVTTGNGFLDVSWNPPASDGGRPIISYTVTAGNEPLDDWGTCEYTVDSPESDSCTVTGLTNGVTYDVSVVATNANGYGLSSTSGSGMPLSAPRSPQLGAQIQPTSATIMVGAPQLGDSPVDSYTLTASPGDETCTLADIGAGALRCTLTGLTMGTTYTVSVAGTNAKGTTTATMQITPTDHLGAATNVSVVEGDSELTINWQAPAPNPGVHDGPYRAVVSEFGQPVDGCDVHAQIHTCTISQLDNGHTYDVQVFLNTIGFGPTNGSVIVQGTPHVPLTVPSAPTNAYASRGDGLVTVSWNPPYTNGGSTITSYTATSSPGGFTCTYTVRSPEIDECDVTGLTPGTDYTFSVTATNAIGTSLASASSASVTAAVHPTASGISVTAVAGNASAVVSWSAVEGNFGVPLWGFGYSVTSSPGGYGCFETVGLERHCIVTGLTNGTAYTFTVKAVNIFGFGPASDASSPVTPATTPGVPASISAVAGDAQATVSWTAPSSDGGSPITGYTVSTSVGSHTCSWTSGPLTCTVTGLTNGTRYIFKVRATNALGTGFYSDWPNSATPATTPGVPASISAVAGDAQATVSWTAPASNGGSSITGYTVTSSPGDRTCSWSTGALSCVVTGLTNGTSYTFTVRATNAAGTGSATDASSAVTPTGAATEPSAPNAVEATAGDAQATVSWSAPTSDGGSAITSYTVTSSPDALTCTSSTTSCTVTGLTNGTAYTFTVTATNAIGDSTASSPSSAVTPTATSTPTVPGAPTDASAAAGDSQATVSWNSPLDDGGSAITSYTVTASPDGATCTSTVTVPEDDTCTVTGLTNGTAYTFTVTATNAIGDSTASSPSSAVTPSATSTPTAPGAPTDVMATAGDGKVTVSWNSPVDDGGSAITAYTATASPGGATCSYTVAQPETDTCSITGLTNGTAYTVTVTATNAVGDSSPSSPSSTATPSAAGGSNAPFLKPLVAQPGALKVKWAAPTILLGRVFKYVATAVDAQGVPVGTCKAAGSARTCRIHGLTSGTAYTVSVIAKESVGPRRHRTTLLSDRSNEEGATTR